MADSPSSSALSAGLGVNRTSWGETRVAEPALGALTLATPSESPSGSMSFVVGSSDADVPCGVAAVSFTATGESLSPVTVTVMVPVAVRSPSLAV